MHIQKDTYKTLRLFYKRISLTDEEMAILPENVLADLKKYEFISREFVGYLDGQHAKFTNYHITEAGKIYFQSHSKIEWLKQNWLSFFSLIFAFIAAIPVIIQGISYILRSIA